MSGQTQARRKLKQPQEHILCLSRYFMKTGKIAIGKVVLREREQLVALRAYQRGLVMHQLKYLDEIRPMD
jgi:non-homologous end joining protein Ku